MMITSFFKPKRTRNEEEEDNNNNIVVTTNDDNHETETDDNGDVLKKKLKTTSSLTTAQLVTCITPMSSKKNLTPAVAKLLFHLQRRNRDNGDGGLCWRQALHQHLSSPSFARLADFVESQRNNCTIYPPPKDTFTALNWTPLDQVKVVIVGQDPYHGPNQAHGLCFSVHRGQKVPPSLRNIYKELVQDDEIDTFKAMPQHGYLERWARQGVLMINTVLTVRRGDANSHQKKGWEEFTDEVIRAVDRNSSTGVVFLLWGKPASTKMTTALTGRSNKVTRHTVISTSHPSPLGATKTDSPFLGSKCFSRANKALRKMGHNEIDWRVDGQLPTA
ncbi:uracil-DNA glycosylase [Nitzschia inconspicua]|uniref:Uracil-DNA glycosylase n=1 Tax=Nitzschia inconspicua TaxID=303405 RepID=A0A9K3KDA0_9STRA|nr:uracil-DNA glycosylase [Nitzschia inconspicua]